jgi:PHD/YefM family antitoxin component YafN of YafNO toxin-antitoxin module
MGKERQFVVNEQGERVAVVISIEEYEKILEELEDLDDIRAYDEAKASGETGIPLEQALAEIRRNRK